mmetsp:Transcript_43166/g.108047  ORF Transcript_43166/g.108047 Transcript_43166/m.108047 type:complete len:91 (-) Transcript_43166:228-500(-)|eukprot:CAMPEP_0173436904 /NCGR_PEP_ID=MMETSP1357-20121228/17548_1 /TAXON_ID=77926 /ORGANISM="Hemiselmis rufescens, Strain PCC563" /LENGTH=90 /DNA_ID=CAMNT_0014402055 /DNA_START=44 /DNA_END=316 /DNA_ORIENTATION=+
MSMKELGLVILAATPMLAAMTHYKSWPEMEGRGAPFQGWPKQTELEKKKEELAGLKAKVVALEKEINPPPVPASSTSSSGGDDWMKMFEG